MAESLYQLILKQLAPVIEHLQRDSIECHIQCENNMATYLSVFTFLEAFNRAKEHEGRFSLEEFEQNYHGIEVGNIRRFLNKILFSALDYTQPLVDYGCGGLWWKDTYWPRFPSVVGIEISPEPLIELRRTFPDTKKYKLIFTPTGLTELP